MQWIKSHLTLVICGLLSVASIVMLVLGVILPETPKDLESDSRIYSSLQGAGRSPVNPQVIEQERTYQIDLSRRLEAFTSQAVTSAPHKPLHPDVFPEVRPGRQNAPFEFKEAFKKKQEALMTLLRAKDKPSPTELEDNRDFVARQKAKEERSSRAQLAAPGAQRSPTGGRGIPRRPIVTPKSEAALGVQKAITPEDRVKNDPDAAFGVRRAREIYCYATVANLDPQPAVTEGSFPSVESMWRAQVSMWIQEDVIGALARLNNRVAEPLPEEARWVGHLPVKRLVYLTIGDYVPPAAEGGRNQGTARIAPGIGSQGRADLPPGKAEDVFTGRGSTETFDLIRFAVGLVVDAQSLLKVINAISEAGSYTPLMVNYRAEQSDPTLTDYIYGSSPVVQVRLEYEVSIRRSEYEQWMPASIKGE